MRASTTAMPAVVRSSPVDDRIPPLPAARRGVKEEPCDRCSPQNDQSHSGIESGVFAGIAAQLKHTEHERAKSRSAQHSPVTLTALHPEAIDSREADAADASLVGKRQGQSSR
jgi:hypothetical protein